MPSRKFSSSAFNEANLKFLEETLVKQEEINKKTAELLKLKQKQLEIDKALTSHADSMSKQSEIQKEVDARSVSYKTEILNLEKEISKQKKYDLGLSRDQIQAYIDYGKEQLKNKNDETKKATISQLLNENSKSGSGASFSIGNIVNMIADKHNQNYATKRLEQAQKEYDDIRASIISDKKSRGWKNLNSREAQEIIDKETAKKFSESMQKNGKHMDAFGAVLQTAGTIFKSLADVIGRLLTQGMDKQVDMYNNTFEGLSVRNNISRGTYKSAWYGARNYISSNGLYDNIGVSEVQQMWGKMSENGITIDMNTNSAHAIETAVENVVTGKIVPYLDTTSASWEQLQNWQPSITKQIRGIGAATMEINGSSMVANKYLQNMVDDLAPMASLAENEIGKQFAEATGMLEYYRSQGVSDYTIGEMYKTAASIYADPLAALNSNDIVKSTTVAYGIGTGADLNDYGQMMGLTIGSADFYANQVPEGRLSKLYAGVLPTGMSAQAMNEINLRNVSASNAIASGKQTANSIDRLANEVTDYFKSDKNQTETTLQNVTLENFMTELAIGKGSLGNYFTVIETAIKSIGTLIMTNIVTGGIGNGISALSGVGGAGGLVKSSGGLFASLGAAGPVALAVGGVATAVGIIGNLIGGYVNKNAKNQVEAQKTQEQWLIDEKNYTPGQAQGEAANTEQERNKGNWASNLAIFGTGSDAYNYITSGKINLNSMYNFNSSEEVLGKKNFYDFALTGETEAKNALNDAYKKRDAYRYNKIKLYALNALLNTDIGSRVKKGQVASAIEAAVLYQGLTKDNDIRGPFTEYMSSQFLTSKKEIKNAMHASGMTTYNQLMSIYDFLKKADAYLLAEKGNSFLGFPDQPHQAEALKKDFELARTGLNKVPYDNYPALLHEGEAVLTADTANQMRTMIDEYRETRSQMQNIDVIIGEQTNALISKMDEIIKRMRIGNIGETLSDSPAQLKAKERLMDSMLHMYSTKMFS